MHPTVNAVLIAVVILRGLGRKGSGKSFPEATVQNRDNSVSAARCTVATVALDFDLRDEPLFCALCGESGVVWDEGRLLCGQCFLRQTIERSGLAPKEIEGRWRRSRGPQPLASALDKLIGVLSEPAKRRKQRARD